MNIIKSFLFIWIVVGVSCSQKKENDIREKSPHFKNGIFYNTKMRKERKTFLDVVKMKLTTESVKWPEWVDIPKGKQPLPRVEGSQIRVTFINHSTFLIQTGNYNILTDPIYSLRCSPISFAGPKRVHQPAIAFDDLPKIDIVLISHDHYDHLDLDTIDRLVERDRPHIYMGLGVARHLSSQDRVTELDWWESRSLDKNFKITFVEVQHFSGRTLFDRNNTLWGGFVLESNNKKIYFGGDSGYAKHYKKTFQRFGPMDLALIPIGAYAPRYFMAYVHVDPRQAVQAHIDLQSKQSIGMHYGTFKLTAEARDEPVQLLEIEKKRAKLSPKSFITLKPGHPFVIP